MSANANPNVCVHPSSPSRPGYSLPLLLLALIAKGEKQGNECDKERSELASVQEQLLENSENMLEGCKRSAVACAEANADEGGENSPSAIAVRA